MTANHCINGMMLADLSRQDCFIVADALHTRAERIRMQAHDCAVAAGNWSDPEAKRWRNEANALDKLADKFELASFAA